MILLSRKNKERAIRLEERGGLPPPRYLGGIVGGLVLAAFFFYGCQDPLVDRSEAMKQDQALYEKLAPVLPESIGLEDAISIALTHNLEAALKAQLRQVQAEAATQAKLNLIPSLKIDANRTHRTEDRASFSRNINTGEEDPTNMTISSEKTSRGYTLSTAWNLLDFGITYFKARQAANQLRIMDQDYRRLRQNLALDVTRAYWRAVVARYAAGHARVIADRMKDRQAKLKQQIEEKRIPPTAGLENQKRLLLMQMKLKSFQREYRSAMIELGGLLGLKPGKDFTLADPEVAEALPVVTTDIAQLETQALSQRPELFQEDLQEKIQRDQVRIAGLRMFPNAAVFASREYDSNRFLMAHDWYTIALSTSFDLLSTPAKWADFQGEKKRTELIQKKRMILAIGILTQVHLARIDLMDARSQAILARKLYQVQDRILQTTEAKVKAGEADVSELLDKEAESLFSRIRYLTAYADAMVAKQRLENSLGIDPVVRPLRVKKDTQPQAEVPTPPPPTIQPATAPTMEEMYRKVDHEIQDRWSPWERWPKLFREIDREVQLSEAAQKAPTSEIGTGHYARKAREDASTASVLPRFQAKDARAGSGDSRPNHEETASLSTTPSPSEVSSGGSATQAQGRNEVILPDLPPPADPSSTGMGMMREEGGDR